MKKYSWIKKVGKSLVPSDFYIHILQEPMYKAFLYMLFFITLLSVVTGTYMGYEQMRSINNIVSDYEVGLIPPFKISAEGLTLDGDTPVYIDHLRLPIIMDDEGILDINDIMDYDQALFLEKDRIVMVTAMGTTMREYGEFDTLLRLMGMSEFDSSRHLGLLDTMSLVSIPSAIIGQFFASTISFFYYSFMVLMISNITRTILGLGLRLKQVYHMVIYAMTFSTFWVHFSVMLPQSPPVFLDSLVHFVIPSLILFNVFLHIRRKAIDEIQKKNK